MPTSEALEGRNCNATTGHEEDETPTPAVGWGYVPPFGWFPFCAEHLDALAPVEGAEVERFDT